ncbi:FAD-dependent thymidylate synthase [Streptomyces sp. NPDC006235]|uniref:FAD-dependent thymidylate synthase n=1 Tax=Streptomyces sp. NPDC006235 TaxID=3156736 RepID=UPI0033BBF998
MQIDILASTSVGDLAMWQAYGYDMLPAGQNTTEADALAEAAGRICYKSFERKRAATASNAGYLANILDHGHFSVLEHSSVTFLVRDVSRALLAELTRHRHLSFSVVSQRYVDYATTEPVIPPALVGTDNEKRVQLAYQKALGAYDRITDELMCSGLSRKQAREAARSVLPNAAPVDMVVTGNLRAWRDVLGKRHSKHADAEIQGFAAEVLRLLREVAPNSFQDISDEPGE